MLNLLRIGTGLAFVLAIVSASLWRDLRKERDLTADLRLQLTQPVNRDSAPAPVVQRIDVPREVAAPVPGNAGGNRESPAPKSAQAAALINLVNQSGFSPERDLMKDPEYRKARLIQTRMNLKRNYTGVAEEVGLSERETEQLFDILAEQQLDGGSISVVTGPDGQTILTRDSSSGKQEEALRALLGPDRQAKWQEYQLSLSARSRATAMSSMLASSGAPLTEAQMRPLTTALIAEEKYVRQQQSTVRQVVPKNAESFAQRQEESVNRQEESNRRYLETAAPYMSPQQLALVRQTLEQQIAISRASARMQRQRAEAPASGTLSAAPAGN